MKIRYNFLVLCVISVILFSSCSNNQYSDSEIASSNNSVKDTDNVITTDTTTTIATTSDNIADNIKIGPYLNFDWTSDEVLLKHELTPDDSGTGWQFSLADIDFNGKKEMLVAFSANNCGNNCLYIYRNINGKVVHYGDVVAASKSVINECCSQKDYQPEYFNTDIIDAYKNNQETRYLSSDYSSVSGITTYKIYELKLTEKNTEYNELAQVSFPYDLPEGEKFSCKCFFKGKQVKDLKELNNNLGIYMNGFTKTSIKYYDVKKTFSRDIVSYSDHEKEKELQELYNSINKC